MAESSGLGSLLDALREGGIDVDEFEDGEEVEEEVEEVVEEPKKSAKEEEAKNTRGPRRTMPGDGKTKNPYAEVETKLTDRVATWTKKTLIVAIVLAIVILLAAYWWFHPPISINSVDTWMFVGLFILLPLFMFFRIKSTLSAKGTKKAAANPGKEFVVFLYSIINKLGQIFICPDTVGGQVSHTAGKLLQIELLRPVLVPFAFSFLQLGLNVDH